MKFLLLSSLFFLATALLHAQQPGTLDPSFANKGILVDTARLAIIPEPVKVTANGRILIGTAGPYGGFSSTFKIDALLPDGSPDLSFGEEGSAHAVFAIPVAGNYATISSLALLPEGKILAAGLLSTLEYNLAFARFNADGSLDSSFGTNGTAIGSTGYYFNTLSTVAVQADGRFLIGGSILTNSQQGFFNFYTARFLPDGTKDISYGTNGIILTKTFGAATSIGVQEDGKIVAAGFYGTINYDAVFHIERYNTDGSYDKSYGNGGIVETPIGLSADISSIALQSDGKLLASGKSNGNFAALFTVVRYNVDGSLDNSFGKGGIVTTPFPQYNGEGKQVLLTGEKKDKIIVAGTSFFVSGDDGSYVLVGYNADGSLDTGFGEGGIQTTRIDDKNYLYAADLQPDGRIIVNGEAYTDFPFSYHRALARYNGYPVKVSLIVRIKRWLQNHTLSWKGLPAEDKIAYYSVEQSATSSKGFAQVAKVSGVSNLKEYNITNSSLLQGINYYRIKAVSTGGVVRYSEVVSADNTANTASVYPNPAKSYVTVQGLKTNETANISIKNGSGTVVSKGVSRGGTQYSSPLSSNMQPGTYYINITTATKTETLKFIKE